MKTILNNPYRIVGLLVGATAREQAKQISRLKKYIEAEQDPQDDFSFPALGEFRRTLESVEEAASKLTLDNDKINAALFWFWNGNPVTDEAAFESLKSGDIEAAYEIWDKLITKTDKGGKKIWKPVTEKNYSAFHNYSLLNFIRANGNFSNAIVASLYFLESDLVGKFVTSVVDETYKTNKKELQLLFLNQLHSDIEANNKSLLPKLLETLNKQEFIAKQDFMKRFVQKYIEQIEHKIETAKNKRKASKANAAKAGQELYTNTSNDLAQLKSIVGASDLKYTSIADKVANEILQCSIDYFNYNQEQDSTSDYADIAMKLAKQAETIAVGKLTKDRIKDSIETLEDMKERELSHAIKLLKSVKDAYETNEAIIIAKVLAMSLHYNQAINSSKVNELIEKSIDWDKVVELILKVIPPQNIDKIKRASNASKISEYKYLVEFVLSKISNPYKSRIAYINYWETPKQTTSSNSSSSSSRTIISSSSSSSHSDLETPKPITSSSSSSSSSRTTISHKTTIDSSTNTSKEFDFKENAWWILGGLGAMVGLLFYHGWGILIGAIIGLIIAGIIHEPWVLIFPAAGTLIGLFWGSENAVVGAIVGGITAISALLFLLSND
jgi:hypothetical protein